VINLSADVKNLQFNADNYLFDMEKHRKFNKDGQNIPLLQGKQAV